MATKVDERCLYNKTHEWVRIEGEVGYAGISDYAQDQLGDIVYVELPEVGDTFGQGEVFGVVESVKAASDLYMPLAGEILEVNNDLNDSPELVNQDPYGEGWFIKIAVEDEEEASKLLDAAGYRQFAEQGAEEGEA